MTPLLIWWALKNPKGEIMSATIAPTKTACWDVGFNQAGLDLGLEWRTEYMYRWQPSIRSALKHGYKFCRVRIEEVR